jgi:hypothetical protein
MNILLLSLIVFSTEINTGSDSKEIILNSTKGEIYTKQNDNIETALVMSVNGIDVHVTLNNTVVANEFKRLIPYTVTVSRASSELRASIDVKLTIDPSENHQGWKLGEIGWFGGRIAILLDNEDKYTNISIPIIGSINKEDLGFVRSIKGSVEALFRLRDAKEQKESVHDETRYNIIHLKIGETVLTATLANNTSTEALKGILAAGPITLYMRDYGNMEKVGSLGTNLPRNDEPITTEPGDLILYQGNAFVIYYATNSWNFTRIGKINNTTQEELKRILGNGDVTITLFLD